MWPPRSLSSHSPGSIVLRSLCIQLEGAGDIDRHAGVLDEQVLHRAAAHAVGAGLLCSKTGGRGDKPTLVHQAGAGQGGRGAAGVSWDRGRWRGRWWRRTGPHRAPVATSPCPPLCTGVGSTAWGASGVQSHAGRSGDTHTPCTVGRGGRERGIVSVQGTRGIAAADGHSGCQLGGRAPRPDPALVSRGWLHQKLGILAVIISFLFFFS